MEILSSLNVTLSILKCTDLTHHFHLLLCWTFKTKEKNQKPLVEPPCYSIPPRHTFPPQTYCLRNLTNTCFEKPPTTIEQTTPRSTPTTPRPRITNDNNACRTWLFLAAWFSLNFPPTPRFWGSTSTVILSRLTFGRRVYVCACATQVIHHRKWFQSVLIIKQGTHFSGTTQRIALSKGKQEREREKKKRKGKSCLWKFICVMLRMLIARGIHSIIITRCVGGWECGCAGARAGAS